MTAKEWLAANGYHAALQYDNGGLYSDKMEAYAAHFNKELVERNAELEALFTLQHERTQLADALWRNETGEFNALPDLGTLVGWLMEWGERGETVNKGLVDALGAVLEDGTIQKRTRELVADALAKNGGVK